MGVPPHRLLRVARKKLHARLVKARLSADRLAGGRTYVMMSSPRSGSTWLSQSLSSIENSCVLFEPLHPRQAPGAKRAGFSWRTYVQPDARWPAGQEYLGRVFAGRELNSWMLKEVTLAQAARAENLIVKFVRANRLLPWLCNTFDLPAPVLLVRHPCAVVASRIRCGWVKDEPPTAPPFLDRFPAFRRLLEGVSPGVESMAADWALDQLPALLTPPPQPWTVVTYEELLQRPESTLSRVFGRWGLPVDHGKIAPLLERQSSVTHKSGKSGLEGWRKHLTPEQADAVLRVVHGFGLRFYGDDPNPDAAKLHGDELAKQIAAAGGG